MKTYYSVVARLSALAQACRSVAREHRQWLGAGLFLGASAAVPAAAQVPNRAVPRFFQVDGAAARAAAASPLAPQLRQYRAYTLDLAGLRGALAAAPVRGNAPAAPLTLALPMPDGTTQRFRIWEAPVMAPALAVKYPTLHTYGGQGIENPLAQLSLTVSPLTFSAQVLNGDEPRGTAYVQAAAPTDAVHYLSYFAQDVIETPLEKGGCGSGQLEPVFRAPLRRRGGPSGGNEARAFINPVGPTLTVYRVFITTTQEYTNGRTDAAVQAEVVGVINFVRTIQERDLAITISLVGTKFYRAGDTGNYSQTSDFQMLKQNQLNVNGLAAASTYDYAHLFASSGSGLAFTGTVGNNNPVGGGPYENPATSSTTVQVNAPLKAGAVSGSGGRTVPAPDYFAASVVAHEMGHQFSASHTANTGQGACTSNRTPGSAWEAGKGSTIMSYADVGCDSPINNVIVSRADPYYHTGSLEQIRTFIETIPAVGTAVASGNRAPAVAVPINRTIPRNTPFKLTATGTDADGDVLRYAWEELDLGPAADLTTAQVTNDNVPLFRSVLPGTTGATRYFPRLSFLGGSPTASTSNTERLPAVARTLTFRCTVRDYHAVAGAVAANTASGMVGGVALGDLVVLAVSAANAAPFAVTAPNTAVSWAANSIQNVTWNGVGTKTSAVNCQTVNVRLSTDGGVSYPVVLAAGVPNVDGAGSVSVTMPNTATTTARVMLEAADNYFFDISDVNFTITAAPAGPAITSLSPTSGPAGSTLLINGTGFGTTAADVSVTVGGVAATITSVGNAALTVTVPGAALTGAVVATRSNSGAANGTANGGVFQVTPVVLSANPTAGTVGNSVVIAGNSFGGATLVSFNGVEMTTFAINTAVSPNTITVNVPVGATTGRIIVYTAGGGSNENVLFTVVPFVVVSLAPALNTRAVREFSNVVVAFNAPANASNSTTAPVRVSSLQADGRKAGPTTVSGNAITFDPTASFRAGEVVQVSVTPAAVSTTGAALAQGYVSQFTVRARAASGISSTTSTATGTRPEHVVAGNLNADANLDLVVVNRTASTVSVFLKDPTGPAYTQAAGSPMAVSATPNNAALADFDNDGNLDLVVACGGGSVVNVFRGSGSGTFTQQASLAATDSNWITVGDLNGDGNLDVVATLFTNPGGIVIGLGDGTSSLGFATSTLSGLGAGPRSVALADFNEDGKLDVAVANFNGTGTGGISVRLGTGAGSFTGSTELVAVGANGVVVADLTGDGHADLATANTYGTGLSVFAGIGTGTFGSPTALALNTGFTYTLSTGDYDGNGTIDLIAPRSGSGAGGVEVFSYNGGTGTYTGPTIVASGGFGPGYVAVADLNNDRALDFAAVNSANANTLIISLATPGAPLPVELVAFSAKRSGPAAVELAWRTASELRNAGFVVERSPDGTSYGPVSAFLPGLGTSSAGQQYRHLDGQAPPTLLYYRLRQVDADGTVKYSPVATVAAGAGTAVAQLLVFPNPSRLVAFVQRRGPGAPDESVRVLDALGRQVRHAPAPPAGGTLEVSLRGLPAGLYVVRCGALSQRLVVE